MKSLIINKKYGLANVELAERPVPVLGDYDILVQVRAVALNQLDLMVAEGVLQSPLPHILGIDAVGIVAKKGS